MKLDREALIKCVIDTIKYSNVKPLSREQLDKVLDDFLQQEYVSFETGCVTPFEFICKFYDYKWTNTIAHTPFRGNTVINRNIALALGLNPDIIKQGSPSEVSIWVRGGVVKTVVSWLEKVFTNLHEVKGVLFDDFWYDGNYNNYKIAVRMHPTISFSDKTEWLRISIYSSFNNNDYLSESKQQLPWMSNVEFAQIAFKYLQQEIECIPEDEYKKDIFDPFEWWRISKDGEGTFLKPHTPPR